MHPVFTVFGFSISAYGVWSVLGIAAAWVYLYFTNRGSKAGQLPANDLLHLLLMAAVGAIVGAKVFYVLITLPGVFAHFSDFVAALPGSLFFLFGGLVFYGGLIGGFFAVMWYCRHYKLSLATTAAIVTPAVPLFHAFGRVGCFFAGCCWGVEVPWGIAFTHSLGAPNGVPYLPIQLIEAGGNLLLFATLAIASRRLSRKWMVLPIYLVSYGLLRFTLEFFRGDAVRGVWLLSTSQWVALAIIAIVMVLYFTRWRQKRPARA